MDIADCAQTLCCLFCGQVSLGLCQHFITNHKFTYGGGAQQRRIKVRVQLPVLILFAIKWRAVPAHRVGEGALEEVVITTGQLFQRQRGYRLPARAEHNPPALVISVRQNILFAGGLRAQLR